MVLPKLEGASDEVSGPLTCGAAPLASPWESPSGGERQGGNGLTSQGVSAVFFLLNIKDIRRSIEKKRLCLGGAG